MSRCIDCGSKGECESWCGREPRDMQDEIDELNEEIEILNFKIKEAEEILCSCLKYVERIEPYKLLSKYKEKWYG